MKKLSMQRRIAAEALGVGENKVKFDSFRLEDISKAITRQDIDDLIKDKAIMRRITGKSGKKKERKRKGTGSRKMRVKNRKSKYVRKIRKLRRYLSEMRDKKIISKDEYSYLRKLSKAGQFKTRRYLKDYLTAVMKKTLPKENK